MMNDFLFSKDFQHPSRFTFGMLLTYRKPDNCIYIYIYFHDLVTVKNSLIWQLTRSRLSAFNYPSSHFTVVPIARGIVCRRSRTFATCKAGWAIARERRKIKRKGTSGSRFSRDSLRETRERAARGFPRRALMELSLGFALAIGGTLIRIPPSTVGEILRRVSDRINVSSSAETLQTHCSRLRKRDQTRSHAGHSG